MEILLPDDKGIGTLVEKLSKGVQCRYRSYDKTCEIREELEIGVQILPPSVKFSVSEEMLEKAAAFVNLPPRKKATRVAGRQPLLLIEKGRK
jgi:hypothetical protein